MVGTWRCIQIAQPLPESKLEGLPPSFLPMQEGVTQEFLSSMCKEELTGPITARHLPSKY